MAKKKQTAEIHTPATSAQALPGMEDVVITDLENIAMRYAEIRDQRQELTLEEVALKGKALEMMHKHQKQTYQHNGIKIWLIPGEENVKVRIKDPEPAEA